MRQGQKIQCIKIARECFGIGLRESKELVEECTSTDIRPFLMFEGGSTGADLRIDLPTGSFIIRGDRVFIEGYIPARKFLTILETVESFVTGPDRSLKAELLKRRPSLENSED